MPKAKRSHIGFKLDNIEPHHDLGWILAGPKGHKAYWTEAARIGMQVKDRSIARGLGKDGEALRAISQRTRDHRVSAMTPNGKGYRNAPPLTPGRKLSRTRAYLRCEVEADGVWFFWRFDRHTGLPWGVILQHQAKQRRDVVGLSFDDWDEIARRMDFWWRRNRTRLATGGALLSGIPARKIPAAIGKPNVVGTIHKGRGGHHVHQPIAITLPPSVVVMPTAPKPVANPLAGAVLSPADARLVIESNKRGIFSGFRNLGPFLNPFGFVIGGKKKKKA